MNTILVWIAILAVCSFFYTATTTIFTLVWILSTLRDTLAALRTKYPSGRSVGIKTRQKAMREALGDWVIFILGQYISQARLDRLVSWLPFYTSVKVVAMACFLYERNTIAQKVYESYLRFYLLPYEPAIDLFVGLVSATIALVYHFTLELPLWTVKSGILLTLGRRPASTYGAVTQTIHVEDLGLILIDSDDDELHIIKPHRAAAGQDGSPLRSAIAHRSGRSKTSPVQFAYANQVATYEPESPPSQQTKGLPERMKLPAPCPPLPEKESPLPPRRVPNSSPFDILNGSPSSRSSPMLKRTRDGTESDSSDSDSDEEQPARHRPRIVGPTATSIYPALPASPFATDNTKTASPFALPPPPAPQVGRDVGPIRSPACRNHGFGDWPYPKTSPRRGLQPNATVFAPNQLDRVVSPARALPSSKSPSYPSTSTTVFGNPSSSLATTVATGLAAPTTSASATARPPNSTTRELGRSSTYASLARPTALSTKPANRVASSSRLLATANANAKQTLQHISSRYASATASSISRSNTLASLPAVSSANVTAARGRHRDRDHRTDRGRSTAPSPPATIRTFGRATIDAGATRPMHKRLTEVRGAVPRTKRRVEVMQDPPASATTSTSASASHNTTTTTSIPAMQSGRGKRKAEEIGVVEHAPRPAGIA